jgi:hypothetical protein
MSKPKKAAPKRMGRPPKPGGKDPAITVRLPRDVITQIDATAEIAGVSRSDAVRKLVDLGLKVKGKR